MSETFKPIYPSASEMKALKEKASFSNAYRFFDTKVVIKSDSLELLEFFKQSYRHFLTEDKRDDLESHFYYVLTDSSYSHGPLLLKDTDRAFSLLKGEALPDSADALIFGSVLTKIKSHFMIHGAALSSQGEGLILSGLSGSGKSTLALELTRRGLLFCSDEIAAVSRSTHLLHPFPRAIGTRESSLKLLENINFEPGELRYTVGGEQKWMVDIEDIFDSSLSGECPGKYLVLLDTAPGEDGAARKEYHVIDIALKEADRNLIERLESIEGIKHLSLSFDGKFHIARFRVHKEKRLQLLFLEACKDFDEVILYKVKTLENPPNPEQDPRLFPISNMDAGLEILGNLQNIGITDGWILEPSSVNISEILVELIEVISGMECYRLLVGNLEKTTDLILDRLIHT